MEALELKNNLLRMVAGTDDPLLLRQMIAIFTSLREEGDWWDFISEAEKRKIEQGMREAAARDTIPHDVVRSEADHLLKRGGAAL
jgi:hypothetical protein